ncbi:MAG: hypothetical protein QOF18_2221 [Frankiaceae bacterium]|nr:hypothetical protein [Frankiaceae bacterium]
MHVIGCSGHDEQVDVDAVAEELYGLSPEEFTAARDEAANAAPDPAAKKAIKALRKPTVAAHEVNRLVRDQPAEIDELVGLGDEIRAAMAGDPADVRRLTDRRRELINSLLDPDLPASTQQDVTATLEAATADPEIGAAVRSGRLVKPLRYAGFGAMPDVGDAVATPVTRRPAPATKAPAAPQKPPARSAPKAAPKPDLTAARDRVLHLAGAADDAQRRYETAVAAATEARTVLERAEAERADAHRAARAAHAEAERARRELGRLERS